MGAVREAVLEFDEEVRAPWRPRLVPQAEADMAFVAAGRRGGSSGRSSARVGACRPSEPAARPGVPPRQRAARQGVRATGGSSVPPRHAVVDGRVAHRAPAGLRLTRRARRLLVVLGLAASVALGSWLGPLLDGSRDGELRLAGTSSVVVQPGDTLWSIAGSLDSDADVRVVVDAIQELNGLEGSILTPGQVLVVP